MKSLTSTQRQHLKGIAHSLQPVVMIGNNGLTPAVLKEIERSLTAHELIKVKASSDEVEVRRGWLSEICASTGAVSVQQIGKMFVLYRAAEPAVIALPK